MKLSEQLTQAQENAKTVESKSLFKYFGNQAEMLEQEIAELKRFIKTIGEIE